LPAFNSDLEKFAALDAQVLDISPDSVYSHIAWQKHDIGPMRFPMCSDFYPPMQVTKSFDILREGPPLPGICERAVFIVDRSGEIVFAKVYPLDRTPDNKELLKVLEGMR
jgi:alkyl hydroperoxide reductase subunit AhpC